MVAEAASTNALVADRAREGAAEGLVVVAEHQTAGRGRLDRSWVTPARSALTFSVLLRPTVPSANWPWLPLLTGHAVASALRSVGVEAELKWPNDMLIGGRKVAGILTERVETADGPAVVAGVGLNVGMTAQELPVETATSLAVEGADADRTELLVTLLQRLCEEYDAFQEGGPGPLRSAYTEQCVTIGLRVQVDLPTGESWSGLAVGIDAGGRLLVDGPSGVVPVSAGDVVHATHDPAS